MQLPDSFLHYKHSEITDQVINAFYKVYNTLGYGFLEKVYENALGIELREQGLHVVQQQPITVYYHDHLVGEYYADLVVEGKILVEVKASKSLGEDHQAQLLNYLKATVFEVGLLINFGPKPEVKRFAYDNTRKTGIDKQ